MSSAHHGVSAIGSTGLQFKCWKPTTPDGAYWHPSDKQVHDVALVMLNSRKDDPFELAFLRSSSSPKNEPEPSLPYFKNSLTGLQEYQNIYVATTDEDGKCCGVLITRTPEQAERVEKQAPIMRHFCKAFLEQYEEESKAAVNTLASGKEEPRMLRALESSHPTESLAWKRATRILDLSSTPEGRSLNVEEELLSLLDDDTSIKIATSRKSQKELLESKGFVDVGGDGSPYGTAVPGRRFQPVFFLLKSGTNNGSLGWDAGSSSGTAL